MGLRITLAGQDITSSVQEMSLDITDTLGQGAGAGGGASGRASTCKFLTTLGPAASAVGAGSTISSPTLVRQGEVQVYDASTTLIYGGYVGKITDKTDKKRVYTEVECYDYYQHLDRFVVQEIYSGQTDVFILRDLITKYAPWLDLSGFPLVGTYSFTVQVFKAITLQKAIAKITDVTGYQIWITPDKKVHYVPPLQSGTAPFSLSTSPDFINLFPFGFEDSGFEQDDTAAINRVTFYGGKIPSNDFTQDLSTQANGSNKLFVLGYYPRVAADGKIHVRAQSIGGANDLSIGYLLGTGPANEFKSAGGTADVLLNADAHTLTFDVAPTNSGPGSITCTYRYEYQMIVQLTDPVSYAYYGQYYDGVISDSNIFDRGVAIGRCKTLLLEQSRGFTTVKVHCFKAGLQSGMILKLTNPVRGINNVPYLVQEVETVPLGGGNFKYNITCGAWRWNLVDVLMNTAQAAFRAGISISSDTNNNGQPTNPIHIEQSQETLSITTTISTFARPHGQYYARSIPVSDGHDAYCGFFTIGS